MADTVAEKEIVIVSLRELISIINASEGEFIYYVPLNEKEVFNEK